MRNPAIPSTDGSGARVRIRTLGHFAIVVDGVPLRFDRRGQPKPLELLKALIACGGVNVPQARLTDALWPEAEGDAALAVFTTTLHRLRRLIGPASLLLRNRALSLAAEECWVDALAFTGFTEQARAPPSMLAVSGCAHGCTWPPSPFRPVQPARRDEAGQHLPHLDRLAPARAPSLDHGCSPQPGDAGSPCPTSARHARDPARSRSAGRPGRAE